MTPFLDVEELTTFYSPEDHMVDRGGDCPELDLYYYPEDRLWTDECGFPIVNIYSVLTPYQLRIFLHDESSMRFPAKLFGEDCIVNAYYWKEI